MTSRRRTARSPRGLPTSISSCVTGHCTGSVLPVRAVGTVSSAGPGRRPSAGVTPALRRQRVARTAQSVSASSARPRSAPVVAGERRPPHRGGAFLDLDRQPQRRRRVGDRERQLVAGRGRRRGARRSRSAAARARRAGSGERPRRPARRRPRRRSGAPRSARTRRSPRTRRRAPRASPSLTAVPPGGWPGPRRSSRPGRPVPPGASVQALAMVSRPSVSAARNIATVLDSPRAASPCRPWWRASGAAGQRGADHPGQFRGVRPVRLRRPVPAGRRVPESRRRRRRTGRPGPALR